MSEFERLSAYPIYPCSQSLKTSPLQTLEFWRMRHPHHLITDLNTTQNGPVYISRKDNDSLHYMANDDEHWIGESKFIMGDVDPIPYPRSLLSCDWKSACYFTVMVRLSAGKALYTFREQEISVRSYQAKHYRENEYPGPRMTFMLLCLELPPP